MDINVMYYFVKDFSSKNVLKGILNFAFVDIFGLSKTKKSYKCIQQTQPSILWDRNLKLSIQL